MDGQEKKKSLFRAKLNAQKQHAKQHRVDSPLVRYNEHEQPVCKVCDVVIKSDALWPAHQASRKHHDAIEKYKANAAALSRPNNSKPEPSKELPKHKSESNRELHGKSEHSTAVPTRRSSTLPPGFFDNQEIKRQKIEKDSGNHREPHPHNKGSLPVSGSGTDSFANSVPMRKPEFQASKDSRQVSEADSGLEAKQVKGAVPKGFFDDKEADLRARGITLVKPDVRDEYKEYEKVIQKDLQEVDNRLEEEEFDAADTIEEEESVEQRAYIERVEMLRRKKLELRASRSAGAAKNTEVARNKSGNEDSSSDEECNENFTVDWRAKQY